MTAKYTTRHDERTNCCVELLSRTIQPRLKHGEFSSSLPPINRYTTPTNMCSCFDSSRISRSLIPILNRHCFLDLWMNFRPFHSLTRFHFTFPFVPPRSPEVGAPSPRSCYEPLHANGLVATSNPPPQQIQSVNPFLSEYIVKQTKV